MRFSLIVLALLTTLLFSCKKEEGEGGRATIKGKVYVLDYNNSNVYQDEYYGPQMDVYIIYGGGDDIYDDNMETHYDGSFEFKYLRKGTYTIYAYSKDTTGTEPSGVFAVRETVQISDKKEVVELDDIIVVD